MPFVRISIREGSDDAFKRALAEGVYGAMRDVFAVPEKDKFVVIHEHGDSAFVFDPSYLDIARDDGLVMIHITANNTRSLDQKKALYARISERLARDPGVRPENVFINIVEVPKENWSFGNGVGQYA